MSLESTYKELKHIQLDDTTGIGKGLESTYKELKHTYKQKYKNNDFNEFRVYL